MSERAYSRVYFSVMDDPKFIDIYADDAAFACWVRLLMTADALWPQAPPLPRNVKRRPLDHLVTAGIVDLLPQDRYRIRGLDTERSQRSGDARTAAEVRWQSKRNATASSTRMPSLAKPSQAKPSQAESARDDIVDDYYRLTGRFPSDPVKGWCDRLANEFGYDPTSKELARQYKADPNARTLLGRVENELKAGRHIATKREAEAEKARLEAEARAKDISPAKAADNQRALKALMADWFSKDAA